MTPDLLTRTAELVGVASVSHHEAAIADLVEAELRAIAGLSVERVGSNVVARTELGRPLRLLLAGHLDTVPASGNEEPVRDGERISGLGAVDMKGGLAVLIELARSVGAAPAGPKVAAPGVPAGPVAPAVSAGPKVAAPGVPAGPVATTGPSATAAPAGAPGPTATAATAGTPGPAVDVTWVFYACEEVDHSFSGLTELARLRPELLVADAAVLAEPTGALVEAGCQGSMRLRVTVTGERAHTARAWMGTNAIHRLGAVLAAVAAYEPRRAMLGGCEFVEALQAVRVEGGVANNVVPDVAQVVVNHRFAPDRDRAGALEQVCAALIPALGPDDSVEVEEAALPAPPCLDNPLLASLVARSGSAARAKLGWTDVSWFAARGVPAANYGPGDPALAHTAGEWVDSSDLETTYRVLRDLLVNGP